MENKIEKENEEVDLRDYFNLIFSKKWLVLGIFLATIIIAVIYNYLTPKIYEINIWLEIGKVENTTIETPVQIIQKMKIGIYGEYPYDTVVLNPVQTNLIQIKLESAKPEKDKNDLEKICESFLADHEGKTKIKKDAIENEIKRLGENVVLLKKEQNNLEAKLGTSITEFDLFFVKDRLIQKGQEIERAYSNIELLKSSLGNISGTQVISDTISDKPTKPNSLVNIVLAGILGLFLGILFIFLKKWWEDYKN